MGWTKELGWTTSFLVNNWRRNRALAGMYGARHLAHHQLWSSKWYGHRREDYPSYPPSLVWRNYRDNLAARNDNRRNNQLIDDIGPSSMGAPRHTRGKERAQGATNGRGGVGDELGMGDGRGMKDGRGVGDDSPHDDEGRVDVSLSWEDLIDVLARHKDLACPVLLSLLHKIKRQN